MNKIIDFLHDLFAPGTDSKQWSLNMKDIAKGAIVATFTPPITILYQTIQQWLSSNNDIALVIDWKVIIGAAFTAFVSYIGKNFFTRSK